MSQIYNICKYWNESEHSLCQNWDATNTLCKYYTNNNITTVPSCPPIDYPFCNLLGTNTRCPGYIAGESKSMCILPNPGNHICNRRTGHKWVLIESEGQADENGHMIEPYPVWSFDDITGYNEGDCNSYGTQIDCTGYTPKHLGFGILQPSEEEVTFDDDQYTCCPDTVFGFRLPLDYEVLNLRARLSPCAWWSIDIHEYAVDQSQGKISYFDTQCTFNGTEVDNFRNGGVVDDRFYYKCNGCSADCPAYTGVCWRYCVDLKLSPGDKVLAEQIHELRYYMRRERWTASLYSKYFDDYEIFAWKGWGDTGPSTVLTDQGDIIYPVKATKVYISSFNPFTIGYEDITIVAGSKADDQGPDYPSLIRELRAILLDPIIRNQFDQTIEGNYIESLSLMDDDEPYILGDVFYDTETYVLNLSDPELKQIMPTLIYQYDTMFELKASVGANTYANFQEELDDVLTKMILYFPEKLRLSLTGQAQNSFIININTYYGENTIVAFNKGSTAWGYDKITFNKYFVGGIIRQTNFAAISDGGTVSNLPNYEESFNANSNDNVSLSFVFDPVRHDFYEAPVSYVYNDYDYNMIQDINECTRTPEESYHLTGYTIYAIEYEEYILSATEYINLNSMYILFTLYNTEISNAILPWTCEKIEIIYADGSVCELEIVEHSFDRKLAPNQVFVYPDDIAAFRAPCKHSDSIVLTNLRTYQKRSFGQLPTAPEGTSLRLVQTYSNQLILDNTELAGGAGNGPYTLAKFTHSVVAGAVFQGRSGRDVGTTRTKMLTWVKQPFSPDVEIKYDWQSNYKVYRNLPECFCHGRWTPKLEDTKIEIREPYCGDHNKYDIFDWKSFWTGSKNKIGPMWWPYTACDGYQAYEEITNQGYTAMEIMSEFTEVGDDGYIHGQHDLRMLGPDYMKGWQGDFCPIPSWCSCNRRTLWMEKIGGRDANIFVGWAQYRSGVSATQIGKWRIDREAFPMFGNASRPTMRSYRSIDRVQYYDTHDGCARRRWKWLPAPMGFSEIDITYYDDDFLKPYATQYNNNVLNPMGYILATTIDDVSVSEQVDTVNRYKFDDIFRIRGHEAIVYPSFDGSLFSSAMPWHEFKYYGSSNQSIQWAWREKWLPLERRADITPEQIMAPAESTSIKKPFIYVAGTVKGLFICLGIDHPDYQYDMYTRERTVMTYEDSHTIKFIPPIKDEHTGEYISWPKVQLDDGLPRYFTYLGEWDPGPLNEADPNYDEATKSRLIYVTCTQSPWITSVTLFDDDYLDIVDGYPTYDDIPEENSIKLTLDTNGVYTYDYFQTGLAVDLYPGAFSLWPKNLIPVQEFDAYIYPDIWATTPTGTDYHLFNEEDITFTFIFDEHRRTISRVIFEFKFGHEDNVVDGSGNPLPDRLYHIPAIYIYAPYSETEAWELYDESMIIATPGVNLVDRTVVCDLTVPFEYTYYGSEQVVIRLRRVPTEAELEAIGLTEEDYEQFSQRVSLQNLQLYEEELIEAEETIIAHERKYYVSYGNHGNMAPQGDDDNLLLDQTPKETSTVWQRDSRVGVMEHTNNDVIHHVLAVDHHKTELPNSDGKMSFINKCRGRLVDEIQLELEPILDTTDIATIEEKQKDMFDKAMALNHEDMSMGAFLHPELTTFLKGNNAVLNSSNSFELHNSFVMPLAEIIHYPTYSPAGHQYVQGSYEVTFCGDRSFTYEYIQREETFSEAREDEEGNVYQVTTATTYGDYQRGLGTAYIDPEYKLGPFGYLRGGINEVTKYALGTTLILQRVEMMGILMKNIYPRYFSRETGSKIYKTILTEYTMPTSMQNFPFEYFPSNNVGVHELANMAMNDFYMYGGWQGRYLGGLAKEGQILLDLLAGRYN